MLTESLILAEFVADLHPGAGLIPEDPLARAHMRLFIDAVGPLVSAWWRFHRAYGSAGEVRDAVERLQAMLPAEEEATKGAFAVGKFSLADVAVVSFLARMRASIGNDWGTFPEGEGKSLWEEITAREGKFERFGRYVEVLFERQSFKKTFDEVSTFRTHETEL